MVTVYVPAEIELIAAVVAPVFHRYESVPVPPEAETEALPFD